MSIPKNKDIDELQKYINTAQENIACFTMSDDDAKNSYLKDKSNKKKFLTFEILGENIRANNPIRVYVSDDINNFNNLKKKVIEYNLTHPPSVGNQENIANIRKLALIFKDHNKKDEISNLIKELISGYKDTLMSTNFGATALLCEAWYCGKFLKNEDYNNVLRALFIEKYDKTDTDFFMDEMRTGLDLERFDPKKNTSPTPKLTHCDKIWVENLVDESFKWIEYSLIHQSKIGELNPLLIHFPLIADNYFFLGLAYLNTTLKKQNDIKLIPEMYDSEKYPKMRLQIDLVANGIKEQRKRNVIEQAQKSINDTYGSDRELEKLPTKQKILLETVAKYFTCFNVIREGDKEYQRLPTEIKITSIYGISIFAPEWMKKYKKCLRTEISDLKKELDNIHFQNFTSRDNTPENLSAGIKPYIYVFDDFSRHITQSNNEYASYKKAGKEIKNSTHEKFSNCLNRLGKSFNITAPKIQFNETDLKSYSAIAEKLIFENLDKERNQIAAFIIGLEWVVKKTDRANFGLYIVKLLTQRYPEIPCFIFTGIWTIEMLRLSLATNAAWYFYRDTGHFSRPPSEEINDLSLKKYLTSFAALSYGTYEGFTNQEQFNVKHNRKDVKTLEESLNIDFKDKSSDNFKLLISRLFTAKEVEIVNIISNGKSSAAATFFVRPSNDNLNEATRFIKIGHWLEIQKEYSAYQQVIKPKLNNHIARVIQPPAVITRREPSDINNPNAMLVSSLAGFPEVYDNVHSLENIFNDHIADVNGSHYIIERLEKTIELVLFPLQLPTYSKEYHFAQVSPCLYTGQLLSTETEMDDPIHVGKYDELPLGKNVNLKDWLLCSIETQENSNVCVVVLLRPESKARLKLQGNDEDVHKQFGALWIKVGMPVSLKIKTDSSNIEMDSLEERLESRIKDALNSEDQNCNLNKMLSELGKALPRFSSSLKEDPIAIFRNGKYVDEKIMGEGKFGGIHGDLNLNNILYPQNNPDGFLIDFSESSSSGLSAFDLAWLEGHIWNHYLFPNLIQLTQHLQINDTPTQFQSVCKLLFIALKAMNHSPYPDEEFKSQFLIIGGQESITSLTCLKNVLTITHNVRSLITKKLEIDFRGLDVQYALSCSFLQMSGFDIKLTNNEQDNPWINVLSYLSSTYYLNQFYSKI
jgi:hypothetical protein